MLKEKNIALSIVLTIVTFGIYGIVWFVNITDDTANAAQDTSINGGKALLFSILTCGIYTIYWNYKMGIMLHKVKTSKGIVCQDNSILYLILSLLGLSIVNFCLMQSDINDLANLKPVQA